MDNPAVQLSCPLPHIGLITISRPSARNALDEQTIELLRSALSECRTQADLRVLVFWGEGPAFVSGADVAELRQRRAAEALRRINASLFREIEQFPAPTIAAINGFCLGGGNELALSCDIRVAGQGARFGQPEVTLGIIPGAGASYRLPRVVGMGVAKELIFSGRIIDAAEALRVGLVNRVVPDPDTLDTALAMAQEIAKNAPLAVRLAKLALHAAADAGVDAAMTVESSLQAVLFDDPEKDARMDAFLSRRARRATEKP